MPRTRSTQSIAEDRVLSRFVDWAALAPEGAKDYAVHGLVYLVRRRLGMTQVQLARRCGLPQSHIARIETGKVDIQLRTLRRIFKALACGLVVAPRPEKDLDDVLREQARKAARKRVRRVAGTMVMEGQRPGDDVLEELVRAETEKLLRERRSEIWEAD